MNNINTGLFVSSMRSVRNENMGKVQKTDDPNPLLASDCFTLGLPAHNKDELEAFALAKTAPAPPAAKSPLNLQSRALSTAMQTAAKMTWPVAGNLIEVTHKVLSKLEQNKLDLAKSLVKAGGTGDDSDALLLAANMALMPLKMLENFAEHKVSFIACRDNITDYYKELAGTIPDGWPPSFTFENVPGIYAENKNEVVIAIKGHKTDEQPHIPNYKEGHGSVNLLYHESAHAYDWKNDLSNQENDDFQKARNKDIDNLSTYEKLPPPRGPQETFAESLAIFMTKPENMKKDRPELYSYFKKLLA